MQDAEENQRSDQMNLIYKTGMEKLANSDVVLYAEPLSMAQYHDLIVAGSQHIGYLPDCPSRKTEEGVAELYHKKRRELLSKIGSYKKNRCQDTGIVIPTCLWTPVLILELSVCDATTTQSCRCLPHSVTY